MASKQEIQLFDNLLNRGIDANKAKDVVLKARSQGSIDNILQNLSGQSNGPQSDSTGQGQINQQQTSQNIPNISITPKSGTLGNLSESLKKRGNEISTNINQIGQSNITAKPGSLKALGQAVQDTAGRIRDTTQIIGDIAGGAGDIIGAGIIGGLKLLGKGLSTITPDFIEKPIKDKIGQVGASILQSEAGQLGIKALQEGAKAFGEFKKQNPETAKSLESIGNVLSFVPIGKVGSLGTKALGNVTEKSGSQLIKSGEKTITKKLDNNINNLILEPNTKKEKIALDLKSKIGKGGFFKEGQITPDKLEQKVINEVKKVPGIKTNQPIRETNRAIGKEIEKKAIQLEKNLRLDGQLITGLEFRVKFDKLKKKIGNLILIKGEPSKGTTQLLDTLNNILDKTPKDSLSIHKARQVFDKELISQGINIYSGIETPLKFAAKKLRKGLNDIVDEISPNSKSKKIRAEETNLFIAQSKIVPKAIDEARSGLKRLGQKIKKIAGVRTALTSTAVLTSSAFLGSLPTVLGIAGGILGLSITGKLILKPQLRKILGKTLELVGIAIKKTPGNPDLQVIKQELQDFLDNSEEMKQNIKKLNLPINQK